jgi:hypothetical protein
MKKAVLMVLVLSFAATAALAQFPQMRRAQERMQRSIEASEEREKQENAANALPKTKPAKMNVDVQMALSQADHKTFAEAQKDAAATVADGDTLWLYIKFNGKLGDYVLTERDAENDGALRYLMFAEVAPAGDVTALDRYVLQFAKEDLEKPEIKINLTPGQPGRNASIPVFIDVAGTREPGLWRNELRLTNSTAFPRSLSENLATALLTMELPEGPTKYKVMRADYRSMVLRGTTDPAQLPVPGPFYSLPLKTEVTAKLKEEGIIPVRFYFAGSTWDEFGQSQLNPRRIRRVNGVYTYRSGEQCFYGVAEIAQIYDVVNEKWSTDRITTSNNLPLACTQID